jgi:hypothetical protein
MRTTRVKRALGLGAVGAGAAALALVTLPAAAFAQPMAEGNLLPQMSITTGPSTNGSNGDTNPYGLAIVPKTIGDLIAGDVLVADFNSSSAMGGGTTIEEVNPSTGATSTFYQNADITGPVGIAINPSNDIVWVAYYGPLSNGSESGYAVIKPGAAGAQGTIVANFNNTSTNMNLFQGTWGAAFAPGAFFWTNAGAAAPSSTGDTGQVWRLNPNPTGAPNNQPLNSSYTPLATSLPTSDTSGITPSTVAGPQGMVYDPTNGTLYVTDDFNNAIYAIPNALTANGPVTPTLVTMGGALQSPQGIVLNPVNGDLLVVNGATNNDLVEVTTTGKQIATRVLDSNSSGALFGLALNDSGVGPFQLYFDDSNSSTLDTLVAPGEGVALAQADGTVQPFGYQGRVPNMVSTQPIVGIAYQAGSNGAGGWEVTANGQVTAFGTAKSYGGVQELKLNAPIVGIASTPDGMGYWLVGADGGVFNFGDAGFDGNTYTLGLTGLHGAHPLNKPVTGIIPTPDGAGYWLTAADGGVFNFGDASFVGSAAGTGLSFPVAASPLG